MTKTWNLLAVAAAFAMTGGALAAEGSDDLGRAEYMGSCASCHGAGGKGDGALKPFMTKAPSDLTTLAKRSGGVLPVQLVWEMIDGRASGSIGPHGTREMPVWGASFRAQAKAAPGTAEQPEWAVRGRIIALIDYLERIQVK